MISILDKSPGDHHFWSSAAPYKSHTRIRMRTLVSSPEPQERGLHMPKLKTQLAKKGGRSTCEKGGMGASPRMGTQGDGSNSVGDSNPKRGRSGQHASLTRSILDRQTTAISTVHASSLRKNFNEGRRRQGGRLIVHGGEREEEGEYRPPTEWGEMRDAWIKERIGVDHGGGGVRVVDAALGGGRVSALTH